MRVALVYNAESCLVKGALLLLPAAFNAAVSVCLTTPTWQEENTVQALAYCKLRNIHLSVSVRNMFGNESCNKNKAIM